MAHDLLRLEAGGNLLLETGDDLLLSTSTEPLPGEAVWDDETATSDYMDATCSFHGLTIAVGRPDTTGALAAGEATITLDNRGGDWAQYDVFGRLVDWFVGRAVKVWAVLDDEPWWLFAGTITAWRDQANGMVEVEASDAFTRLNEGIGLWDPGTLGDSPADRLDAIADLIAYPGPTRFDTGDVTLYAEMTDRTPLEEMQQVAVSDGGVLMVDADGTLVYRDRTWAGGRSDQDTIPVMSANVCTADAVLWDLELVSDDRILANAADLANVAAVPVTVHAENLDSQIRYGVHNVAGDRTTDQWVTEAEGQALADYLVGNYADPLVRIESALLYLHDPRQDLWRVGIDRRIGDAVRLLHDQPAAGGGEFRLDVLVAIEAITHDITPDGWTVELASTRAVSGRITEHWDASEYRWDETDEANTWGY